MIQMWGVRRLARIEYISNAVKPANQTQPSLNSEHLKMTTGSRAEKQQMDKKQRPEQTNKLVKVLYNVLVGEGPKEAGSRNKQVAYRHTIASTSGAPSLQGIF